MINVTGYDKVRVLQSAQGLLSVQINDQRTDWKIQNKKGGWFVHGYGKQSYCDLSRQIHDKDLPRLVGWVISCLCEPIEGEEAI